MGRSAGAIVFYVFLLQATLAGCDKPGSGKQTGRQEKPVKRTNNDNIRQDRQLLALGPDRLSEYGFFHGELASLSPAENVLPYDINMPLFSDYADKSRFVYIPEDSTAKAAADGSIDFPVGSRLIKTFHYPAENRHGRKLLETRIIEKNAAGEWKALTYIWNDEQTEAFLEVAGGNIDVDWLHGAAARTVNYSVPNVNQCKTCHGRSGKIQPLGPKVPQLNKNFSYDAGTYNQLDYWRRSGILTFFGQPGDLPAFPQWQARQDLNAAARAYLDSNCGSCHHPEGSANTSGLFLTFETEQRSKIGIMKKPVAAGKGSGGRLYSIAPGQPDASILLFRMESVDPGIMMPELGRSVVHEEGVALIRQWISALGQNDGEPSDF